jgi:hypothetical protein
MMQEEERAWDEGMKLIKNEELLKVAQDDRKTALSSYRNAGITDRIMWVLGALAILGVARLFWKKWKAWKEKRKQAKEK